MARLEHPSQSVTHLVRPQRKIPEYRSPETRVGFWTNGILL